MNQSSSDKASSLPEDGELLRKLTAIQDSLVSRRKSLRWAARSLIGERLTWYREVEVGQGEVY